MKKFSWQRQCRDLEAQNKELRERNAWLEERILQLETQNAELKNSLAAARKNSRNSSKPPSSDIVKAPAQSKRKASGKARRIGAQKGHPKHERPGFAPEQIDQRIVHRLDCCPVSDSHKIVSTDQIQTTLQQVELVDRPFVVTEHLAYRIWCEDCQQYHAAPCLGRWSQGGSFGPRLSSFVIFLKGKLHSSYSGVQDLLGTQFKGILGCDCYSAYRKYARQCGVLLQFCLAHLIREVKYLCEHPDRHVQKYGKGLLEALKELFRTLHRKEQMSKRQFQHKMDKSKIRSGKPPWLPALHPSDSAAGRFPDSLRTWFSAL